MKKIEVRIPIYNLKLISIILRTAFGLAFYAQDQFFSVAVLQLAFLTPPFLGGFSAEVCEISPHNSDFL